MQYARDVLKITRILGITTQKNVRSQRLLEKVGLKYVKEIQLNGNSTMLYEWLHTPSAQSAAAE